MTQWGSHCRAVSSVVDALTNVLWYSMVTFTLLVNKLVIGLCLFRLFLLKLDRVIVYRQLTTRHHHCKYVWERVTENNNNLLISANVGRRRRDCPICPTGGLLRLSNHLKERHGVTGVMRKDLLKVANISNFVKVTNHQHDGLNTWRQLMKSKGHIMSTEDQSKTTNDIPVTNQEEGGTNLQPQMVQSDIQNDSPPANTLHTSDRLRSDDQSHYSSHHHRQFIESTTDTLKGKYECSCLVWQVTINGWFHVTKFCNISTFYISLQLDKRILWPCHHLPTVHTHTMGRLWTLKATTLARTSNQPQSLTQRHWQVCATGFQVDVKLPWLCLKSCRTSIIVRFALAGQRVAETISPPASTPHTSDEPLKMIERHNASQTIRPSTTPTTDNWQCMYDRYVFGVAIVDN